MPSTLSGLTGLFGSWIASDAAVQVLAAAGSVLALGACWLLGDRARRRPGLLEPSLAGATALSLLAAPHALTHDLALLAPALVWTAAWVACRPAAHRGLLVLLAGWVLLDVAARHQLDDAITTAPGWCRCCSSPARRPPPTRAGCACPAAGPRRPRRSRSPRADPHPARPFPQRYTRPRLLGAMTAAGYVFDPPATMTVAAWGRRPAER